MRLKTFILACALIAALLLFAQRRAAAPKAPEFASVVDLTHSFGDKTPSYEVESGYKATTVKEIARDGYYLRNICLPEHFGTHIDAPAHFAAGRWTVDQIPPARLIGPLVVIDVSAQARLNADYQVSLDDVSIWEKANGAIPPGAIVMARTGWSEKWNTPAAYRNPDARGTLHFPGFAEDTARFLVDARGVVALGIDTLSVDYGPSRDYPVHHYTSSRSVYHLENVADLDRVPESGAIVLVGPAKLEGGSGGPVRILALLR